MSITSQTLTSAGLTTTPLDDLYNNFLAAVEVARPDVSVRLPSELLEGFCASATFGINQAENTLAYAVNAITPLGANELALKAQAYQMGIEKNTTTRTAVWVTFTGTAGYVLNQGFVVSDGTYQYMTSAAAIINSSGIAVVYCVATNDGAWSIQIGTVTTLISSKPIAVTLSCTNTETGIPSLAEESLAELRGRVILAMKITANGTIPYLKTLLELIGIEPRLISVSSGGTAVYVGGGIVDNYDVAFAVFKSGLNHALLTGTTTKTINNYPNNYDVKFTIATPLASSLTLQYTTSGHDYISESAIAAAAKTAITDYINSLAIGYGLNLLRIKEVFLQSTASIIDSQFINAIDISATTPADDGSGDQVYAIAADRYLTALTSAISIIRV
jgi:hypothetical protein